MLNLCHQVLHAPKRAPANGLLGDLPKPEFHLIEPGSIRRGIVHLVARALRQPGPDFRMFVRRIVIDDQMGKGSGMTIDFYSKSLRHRQMTGEEQDRSQFSQ